jgi:acetylornithine/N-succinyldiaminopimelate aminotransferase
MLKDSVPGVIEDIRGEGLMLGLKCVTPAPALIAEFLRHKLLAVAAGENVVRLLPPLIISDSELSEACEKIAASCQAVTAATEAAIR